MKKTATLSLLLLSLFAKAQQDAMFTHYMYNTLWLNPAYAGTRDALTVMAIHRSQWVGFDGAPIDQTISVHAPIKDRMGWGLSVQNDRIGPTRNLFIGGDYAYQLKLNSKSKLGLGVKATLNIFSNFISGTRLDDERPDPNFAQNYQSVTPNFGAGLYYHRERFYVGLSTPRVVESNTGNSIATGTTQRHFFLVMGTVFKLKHEMKLKPTCFIKATEAAPIEGDFTVNLILKDKFTVGTMYRTGDGAGMLLGYTYKTIMVGYSFDWSLANKTGRYNNGSHEIMIRYDFIPPAKQQIKSPRFF